MATYNDFSDQELPDLRTIILPRHNPVPDLKPLRRSPRKNTHTAVLQNVSQLDLSATSNQQRVNLVKNSPSKHSALNILPYSSTSISVLSNAPMLPRNKLQFTTTTSSGKQRNISSGTKLTKPSETDSLLDSFSRLAVESAASDTEEEYDQPKIPIKVNVNVGRTSRARQTEPRARTELGLARTTKSLRPSRFVLTEAICDEDLADSDAQDDGEEEDTDLSGFIVDDDAEISYHGSSDEVDSEEEKRSRRIQAKEKHGKSEKPKRRLQRGRRRENNSEDEVDSNKDLSEALSGMKISGEDSEHHEKGAVEVIDLTSLERNPCAITSQSDPFRSSTTDLFSKLKALKLSPPRSSQTSEILAKSQPPMEVSTTKDKDEDDPFLQQRFRTPPTTPPQSPTKLKSPSKLLSPSKRGDAVQRSPHRQSMDAFWDLNEVNEWHDQFSPKKAPIASPRKNRLAALELWSDAEDEQDSLDAINESSDSLPSPCESPSKSKSRSKSPIKSEKQRILAEKKARQVEKKLFEDTKNDMATALLEALDQNVTGSRISTLSASTGGVQIIWSKTLRSTAGRANWRRTVTKPTGSLVKGKAEESTPGVLVQHFANIELATKVIDRQDRLINTLAHEFCHLANFMISGVRDQPHGASFQNWARKVTDWMKLQNTILEWKTVQVTTKHGYVIEWKYLWLCTGRDQNKAMKFLNIDEEDGCGAEYGRHSKSIDTDKQRCGRCKGYLVQVRPKPRASPVKKMDRETPAREKSAGKGVKVLEKMVDVVELSD